MSKIYYYHSAIYNTSFKTEVRALDWARNEYKKHCTVAFIYYVDREKKDVKKVGWQFRLKNNVTKKMLKNIYYDYQMALKDAESLKAQDYGTFDIVNEYGERW